MTVSSQIVGKLSELGAALSAIRQAIEEKTGEPQAGLPLAGIAPAIEALGTGAGGWERPAEWLRLPTLSDTDDKVAMLYEVRQNMAVCSLTCAGAYRVDWGDGTSETFASGANAQHTYVLSGLPNVMADGSAQVVVVVSPQSGSSLTSVNLSPAHASFSKSFVNGCLDLAINAPALSSLVLSSVTAGTSKPWKMQQVYLGKNSLTSMVSLFATAYALASVLRLDCGLCTNFSYLFQKCYSLRALPTLNTSAGTSFSNMFFACSALESAPELDYSNVTDCSSMFSSCSALRRVGSIVAPKATNVSNMFTSCYMLPALKAVQAPLATNISSFVSGCGALVEAGPLTFSAATNAATAFSSCAVLERVRASIPIAFSLASCNLSKAALVEEFQALPTVTGSPALTLTGNPGVASLTGSDTAIATAKGWTLVTA